jgi:iron complex transport system ATP-binding protein
VAELVVEASALVAGYHGRSVLRGVDLEVERNEAVCLLGANGSGKTTLLRVLAGTLAPTTGTVDVLGRPIADWPRRELARRVAVLPQGMELPQGLRVADVVALGRIPHARRLFASDEIDERAVAAALRDVDGEDLAGRDAGELSGGERQRVLAAMALAQEPELLLLDEPTLHLDLGHQAALVRLVSTLRRTRGLTVVAVLHDLNLASGLGDRAVVMHEGHLEAAGVGSVDPHAVERALGVGVEEAFTAAGRRVLVPAAQPLARAHD